MLSRIGKNARLGDGRINPNINTAAVFFYSTDSELLRHKENLMNAEGLEVTVRKTQESGYGGTKTIHVIHSSSNEEILKVAKAPIESLIESLDKEDLYLWYLDDGSWHISRNTMHLYSNELDKSQSELLMNRIKDLYGIKPRLRIDRKQDGRQFYYLYFPRDLVRIFRPEVKAYIEKHGIDTMMYKVGGKDYEEAPKTYLTNDEVLYLRTLYTGKRGEIKAISERTGYSYDQVQGVVTGRRYKHVKGVV